MLGEFCPRQSCRYRQLAGVQERSCGWVQVQGLYIGHILSRTDLRCGLLSLLL